MAEVERILRDLLRTVIGMHRGLRLGQLPWTLELGLTGLRPLAAPAPTPFMESAAHVRALALS